LIYHWQLLRKYLVEFSSGEDKIILKEWLSKPVEFNIKDFLFYCKASESPIELHREIINSRFPWVKNRKNNFLLTPAV